MKGERTFMSEQQVLDDRQHAVEFQRMLEAWLPLRLASQVRLHVLARFEPPDEQARQAQEILQALREHGRPTARFVASQVGSSGSALILWWVNAQSADDFTRDNESARRFDDVRLMV